MCVCVYLGMVRLVSRHFPFDPGLRDRPAISNYIDCLGISSQIGAGRRIKWILTLRRDG